MTIAALGTLGDVETWSDTEAAVVFFGFRSNETPTGGPEKMGVFTVKNGDFMGKLA